MADPSLPPIIITEGPFSSSPSPSSIITIVPDPPFHSRLNLKNEVEGDNEDENDGSRSASRGPPLGYPSLSYLSPSSDFI